MKRRCLLLISVVLLLVVSSVAGADSTNHTEKPSEQCIDSGDRPNTNWDTIQAQVSRPNNSSDKVRISYSDRSIPPEFFLNIPREANLTDRRGFEYDRGELRYTGGNDPYVEYRLRGESSYWRSSEASEWTFAPLPNHYNVRLKYSTKGAGVVGDTYAYLGNHSKYETALGCHKISLIVSSSSDMDTHPGDVLSALRYSAENLDVGHRYDVSRLFLIPGRPDPTVGGKATKNEAWVTTRVPEHSNVSSLAIHEYVHTRQRFGASGIQGMLWFTEGSASYYEIKFGYETGAINASYYNYRLRNGSSIEAALDNRSTWPNENTKYTRGLAYVAILDQKLINSTGGNYSVEALIREINNESDVQSYNIRQRQFIRRIQNNSDASTAEWANKSLSSDSEFNYEIATISEKSELDKFTEKVSSKVVAEPFGALLFAFVLGAATMVLIYDISRNNSNSPEEGEDTGETSE